MDGQRDTSPGALKAQLDAIRRMSGERRVAHAFEMSEAARSLAEAGIRHRHPEWPEDQVRAAVRARIGQVRDRGPAERSDPSTE